MSRIYFHTPDGEAEVRGYERSYGNTLGEHMMTETIGKREDIARSVTEYPTGHYMNGVSMKQWSPLTWIASLNGSYEGDPVIRWGAGDNEAASGWIIAHNTICSIGSDAWVFLSLMHLTCEIHSWVPAEHREWFADLINDGIDAGIMRDVSGWESVRDLALDGNDTPIVMSYSVCEQFPDLWDVASHWRESGDAIPDVLALHPEGGEFQDETAAYGWWDANTGPAWDAAMKYTAGSQITPDTLRYRFGPSWPKGGNVFDVVRYASSKAEAVTTK